MNIHIQFSCVKYRGVRLLGWMKNAYFPFQDIFVLFSEVPYNFALPSVEWENCICSKSLAVLGIMSLFHSSHSGGCREILYFSLDLYFPEH